MHGSGIRIDSKTPTARRSPHCGHVSRGSAPPSSRPPCRQLATAFSDARAAEDGEPKCLEIPREYRLHARAVVTGPLFPGCCLRGLRFCKSRKIKGPSGGWGAPPRLAGSRAQNAHNYAPPFCLSPVPPGRALRASSWARGKPHRNALAGSVKPSPSDEETSCTRYYTRSCAHS